MIYAYTNAKISKAHGNIRTYRFWCDKLAVMWEKKYLECFVIPFTAKEKKLLKEYIVERRNKKDTTS